MNDILIPVLILAGMGLLFGIMLGIAAKIFAVKKDERIDEISAILPGANCGGCGYAGCSAYAEAIVKENAPVNLCSAGGSEASEKIGGIMGVTVEKTEKMVARVFCQGAFDKANLKLEYKGVQDCFAAKRMAGGPKECQYGCIGLGSCVGVCQFDAIHVVCVVEPQLCVVEVYSRDVGV